MAFEVGVDEPDAFLDEVEVPLLFFSTVFLDEVDDEEFPELFFDDELDLVEDVLEGELDFDLELDVVVREADLEESLALAITGIDSVIDTASIIVRKNPLGVALIIVC